MFCSNCGLKIEGSNQKFCINCGNNLSTVFEAFQSKSVGSQYRSTTIPQQTSTIINHHIMSQMQNKERGSPGSYSKKCLICAIISLVLAFYQNLS